MMTKVVRKLYSNSEDILELDTDNQIYLIKDAMRNYHNTKEKITGKIDGLEHNISFMFFKIVQGARILFDKRLKAKENLIKLCDEFSNKIKIESIEEKVSEWDDAQIENYATRDFSWTLASDLDDLRDALETDYDEELDTFEKFLECARKNNPSNVQFFEECLQATN